MDKKIKDKIESLAKKKGIYVVISSVEDYKNVNNFLLYSLLKNNKKRGVYVTLNREAEVIEGELKKMGVDTSKLLFVDGITKRNKSNVKDKSNVVYIQGPDSLTELSLVLTESTNTDGFDFVLLDSMVSLLIYNKPEIAQRFTHYFVTKIRDYGINSILLSIEDEKSESFIATISQFCDGVINLSK